MVPLLREAEIMLAIVYMPAILIAMTLTDIAYVAGFLDGEGCVSLAWRKGKLGYNYITPIIQITNTNEEVLIWIKSIFGGSIQFRPDTRKTRKDSWCVTMAGETALKFLKSVRPYLRIKTKQADIVMSINREAPQRDSLGRLKRTITPEINDLNLKAVLEIRKLNKRGRPKPSDVQGQ
jgi:hypothetical protein